MPAHYSDLFDSLLVMAGRVLVIIGVVMFIRSKSSGDASSVEAFGMHGEIERFLRTYRGDLAD